MVICFKTYGQITQFPYFFIKLYITLIPARFVNNKYLSRLSLELDMFIPCISSPPLSFSQYTAFLESSKDTNTDESVRFIQRIQTQTPFIPLHLSRCRSFQTHINLFLSPCIMVSLNYCLCFSPFSLMANNDQKREAKKT